MSEPGKPLSLSPEQQRLSNRVEEMWALARARDTSRIAAGIHPRYAGWDMSTDRPHDRAAAVRSVSDDKPKLCTYTLKPHRVEVYDERVGVVHYAYAATVTPEAGAPSRDVSGRWTEVYLEQDRVWVMIAVSGRPDLH